MKNGTTRGHNPFPVGGIVSVKFRWNGLRWVGKVKDPPAGYGADCLYIRGTVMPKRSGEVWECKIVEDRSQDGVPAHFILDVEILRRVVAGSPALEVVKATKKKKPVPVCA